jgi:hypothetical protein
MDLINFMKACIYAHIASAMYQAVNHLGFLVLSSLREKMLSYKMLLRVSLITLFALFILGVYL